MSASDSFVRVVCAALAALLTLVACAREPAPTISWSLLAEPPAEVLDDPGRIAPDAQRQWGSAAVGRWVGDTIEVGEEGVPMVAAHRERAGVMLRVCDAADRRLALWLASSGAAEEPEQTTASVTLNGVVLGEVTIERGPARFELDAPRAAWVAGGNRLEVEVERAYRVEGEAVIAFRMGEVSWGEPRRVVHDADSQHLTLPAGTSVVHTVEGRGAARLALGARAEVEGTLELVVEPFGPEAGTPREDGRIEHRLELEPGEERGLELELPWAAALPLRCTQTWRPERSGSVELLRLDVGAEASARTPVIVVAVDTLSASHTSVYGYARDTTPSLRAFAEQAVLFESSTSNATWTLPSFCALLSGLHAGAHRLDANPDAPPGTAPWESVQLAPNRWTLAEAFRSGGWRTGAFVDCHWLTEGFGFDQGFEVLDHSSVEIPIEDRSGGIDRVWRLAQEWLDGLRAEDAPFLFLHCYDVHGPYTAAQEWRDRFTDEPPLAFELPDSVPVDGPLEAYDVVATYIARGEQPDGQLPARMDPRRFVNAYDAGIAEVDHKLGRVFDDLRRRGLFEDAVIVVTSDHGESMLEQHRYFAHASIGRAVTRIPLLLRLPGGAHGGQRIADPVQSIDVYPTLLELAGFGLEQRGYLLGRSLVPRVRGEALAAAPILVDHGTYDHQALEHDGMRLVRIAPDRDALPARLSYPWLDRAWRSETFPELDEGGLTLEAGAAIALRMGSVEAIEAALAAELADEYVFLHDLERDPLEETDLSQRDPERTAELLDVLAEARARTERARTLAVPAQRAPVLSEEDLELLRAIGYVEQE